MKILNTENGKEKMYVQLKDISFLLHSDIAVPKSIYLSVLDDPRPLNEHKSTDYYSFIEQGDIDFLKGVDAIIDYKELRNLELAELEMLVKDIDAQIIDIEEAIDTLAPEERDNGRKREVYRIERLAYKKCAIKDLIEYKLGNRELEFPLVPDSDGFSLTGDADYQVSQSIDSNKIVLYRKDGKNMMPDEKIPNALIQMGLSIAMVAKRDSGVLDFDIDTKTTLSPDSKYFVVEIILKKPELSETPETEKGIKSLFKRILNR